MWLFDLTKARHEKLDKVSVYYLRKQRENGVSFAWKILQNIFSF
jgi:hypothetical protein